MVDVAVIGAGFAGLSAARALEASGLSVQVLEARDRVGGRSRPGLINGRVVDTGGQWVGARHERVARLAAEAGATLRPQYDEGRKLLHLGGQLRAYRGLIPPVPLRALIELGVGLWHLKLRQRQ